MSIQVFCPFFNKSCHFFIMSCMKWLYSLEIKPLVIIVVAVLVAQLYLTLRPNGLYPTSLLCPWDSPGKNTGMGCHSLLQKIFPTQGSNPVSFIAGKFFSHHVTCKYFLPCSRSSFYFVSGFLETLLSILLDIYPEGELLDYMVIPFLTLWGTPILFFIAVAPFCTPINSASVLISPHLCNTLFFDRSYPDGYEAVSYCSFDLYFPKDLVILSSCFNVLSW